MKRRIICLVTGLLLFTGCGSLTAVEEGTTETEIDTRANLPVEERENIAICFPKNNEHNEKLAKELTNSLWRRGYNIILNYAEGDAKLQAEQIAGLTEEDIKCLIVYPVDGSALSFEAFEEADIPVVNIEKPVENTEGIDLFIKYDSVKAGELIADRIISDKALDSATGVTIEFLMGEKNDESLDFYNGLMSRLSPYLDSGALVCRTGRTAFEDCSTNAKTPVEVTDDLARYLSGYYIDEDLDVLVTGSDLIANGCDAYFAINGHTADNFPYVTGVNGDARSVIDFSEGYLSVTAFKNCKKEAESCAEGVDDLVLDKFKASDYETKDEEGNKIVPTLVLEPEELNKDNYAAELLNNNYFSEEEIYK